MVGRDSEMNELVSLYTAGDFQLTENRVHNNPKERRISLLMLNKAKHKIAPFLYASKEDQEKCRKELTVRNVKQASQNGERYINLIMALRFFQGEGMKREEEIEPNILERLSGSEKKRKYVYRKEDGKYLSSFFSVPKLVLVNGELFERYMERLITEKEKKRLNELLPKDIHYILNIQNEEQKDNAYLIAKEKGELYMEVLSRYQLIPKIRIDEIESKAPEFGSVALCLLDYLIEFKKLEKLQKQQIKENDIQNAPYDSDKIRISKYIDQNSIKIFDMKPDQMPVYNGLIN